MTYNPTKHHRQSMRLSGFDYSSAGAYFITLCTQNRICLFGTITDGTMILNPAGQMVKDRWLALAQKFSGIQTDEFVVMPNHFHGILILPPTQGTASDADDDTSRGSSIPQIMQWFKTMTTNHYIRGVKINGWMPFEKRVWQRNYYDHIIRNEADLIRIQTYIHNNPSSWQKDQLHPQIPSKW